jgi:hypothetical protein
MSIFGTKAPMLDRDTAMNGYPVQLPTKRLEEKDGKLYVTIEFRRPRWQQILGAEKICERTFGLDPYGREVFDACNGKTNVNKIVRRFARNHHVSIAEAEVSVSTFLKTLMSRGMIGIALDDMKAKK